MRRLSRLLPHQSEAGLKLLGLALAAMSAAFALVMTTTPSSAPRIHGMEHLSVFARPANRSWASKPSNAPLIDYKPIGSVKKRKVSSLIEYEILEATPEGVVLRMPEGRVARVARGGKIAGLGVVLAIEQRGSSWVVTTEAGEIH